MGSKSIKLSLQNRKKVVVMEIRLDIKYAMT